MSTSAVEKRRMEDVVEFSKKFRRISFDCIKLGPLDSAEELDKRVLLFQNKKLADRLKEWHKVEERFNERISILERQRNADESKLCLIDVYWTQLDEDIRILLERFDHLPGDSDDCICEETKSFINVLNECDREGIEHELSARVEFTNKTLRKLLVIYDSLMRRQFHKEESENDLPNNCTKSDQFCEPNFKDQLQLQQLCTRLQEKHHILIAENKELNNKLVLAEKCLNEKKNQIEDLEYELQKSNSHEIKLQNALIQAQSTEVAVSNSKPNISSARVEELQTMLDEQTVLAKERMNELSVISSEREKLVAKCTYLQSQLDSLPKSIVVESEEYKSLSRRYEALLEDHAHMVDTVTEVKSILHYQKQAYDSQLTSIERDEFAKQKSLRNELVSLQTELSLAKKTCNELKLQLETCSLKKDYPESFANDLQQLEQTFNEHFTRVKNENIRFRNKNKELQEQIEIFRNSLNSLAQVVNIDDTVDTSSALELKNENASKEGSSASDGENENDVETLKKQVLKLEEEKKEIRLLLDMYRSAHKEPRDKAEILLSESKLRSEVNDLKNELTKTKTLLKSCRRQLSADTFRKRDQAYEDVLTSMREELSSTRQEEETLIKELEATGLAFEEMQDKNRKLMMQLSEKDALNFKLMTEGVTYKKCIDLLREEKDYIVKQLNTVQDQLNVQVKICQEQQKHMKHLQKNETELESKLHLALKASELHKREVTDALQKAAELKIHVDKYHFQLQEAQKSLADKAEIIERQLYLEKRLTEENRLLVSRYQRAQALSLAQSSDELLQLELQDLRDSMKCASCKNKNMDAVISKCFHVFCMECLKTRYETRQRKCPKCNAAFGLNDIHRIYLNS